jgi:hypothetical protein
LKPFPDTYLDKKLFDRNIDDDRFNLKQKLDQQVQDLKNIINPQNWLSKEAANVPQYDSSTGMIVTSELKPLVPGQFPHSFQFNPPNLIDNSESNPIVGNKHFTLDIIQKQLVSIKIHRFFNLLGYARHL